MAPRLGLSTLELIVALTLLTTALSVGTQVVVRARGVMDDHRDYRLALDEVTNLLDEFTLMPEDEWNQQAQTIEPSGLIVAHLDNPSITLNSSEDALGTRLEVRLSWGPAQQAPKSVALSGWRTKASSEPDADATDEGAAP